MPVARAVICTHLDLARRTSEPASAVAFTLDTKTAVVAVVGAWLLDLADIALPALLAITAALEAIPMARAVRHHFATLNLASGTGPACITLAALIGARTMVAARRVTRTVGLIASDSGLALAVAGAVDAHTGRIRAVLGTQGLAAVDARRRVRADVTP